MRIIQRSIIFLKQYGLKSSVRRFFFKVISYFLVIKEDIILAQSKRKPISVDSRVKALHMSHIDNWLQSKSITKDEANKFKYFLNKKCKGYFIEDNSIIAAWGFVDSIGKYEYGGKYLFKIPHQVHILRNLYVKPEYRGKSYGKIINEARINDIPANCTPVGFVIPENRYAIRNLKIYGFEEYLMVRHISWFNRWEKRKIKILRHGEIAELLMEGFLTPEKI